MVGAFVFCLRILYLRQGCKIPSFVFLIGSFRFLTFMFRPVIHPELICVYGVRWDWVPSFLFLMSFFKRLYLFNLERGGGGGRETLMCKRYIDMLPFACPQLEIWPTTQAVPWLGIEPVIFRGTGQYSIHWATQPGPEILLFYIAIQLIQHHLVKTLLNCIGTLGNQVDHWNTLLGSLWS